MKGGRGFQDIVSLYGSQPPQPHLHYIGVSIGHTRPVNLTHPFNPTSPVLDSPATLNTLSPTDLPIHPLPPPGTSNTRVSLLDEFRKSYLLPYMTCCSEVFE